MVNITKDRLAKILAEQRAKKAAKEEEAEYNSYSKNRSNPVMDKHFSSILNPSASKQPIQEKTNDTNRTISNNVHSNSNTNNSSSVKKLDLSSQLANLRAKEAARKEATDKKLPSAREIVEGVTKTKSEEQIKTETISAPSPEPKPITEHIDKYGNLITYNSKQQEFVNLASSAKSCILIGAAGTGKTTCMQGALQALIQSGKIPKLSTDGHKYLTEGTPGCIVIAYTRRATNNIKRVLSADLKPNAITAHKLLEYAPEVYEIIDPETGEPKKTMRFIESRNEHNPLPDTIATIVVEESSMLSVELFSKISIALQHKIQWIFLGDLNQLPPVFGSAILGFKLLELPVVELTEVYRQALESPIIRLAHRIISGKVIQPEEFSDWNTKNQLTIHPWKKKITADDAVATLAEFFKLAYDKSIYNIDEDIILIPYNKACGTIELNKHIANHIARKNERTTYEVVAGFNKHYFSVGDKVLYDKEDAEIVEISINNGYAGAKFQQASKNLDYWGHNPKAVEEHNSYSGLESDDVDIDFLLDAVASQDSEDRVRKASHVITLKLNDTGRDITIDAAAEVNNLLHAYALTVHKAQGSEWRKVYLCFHQSHATMLQRELLYTGVTRAREELYVICEPDSFVKGIQKQRIKGDTLAEKAEFFKGKLEENEYALLGHLKDKEI